MKRIKVIIVAAVCVLMCATGAQARGAKTAKKSKPIAEHVVFIGLDGLSAHAFERGDMPVTKELMSKGAFTLHKRSALPSSSAINWASMFMGAGPELHGYTTWGSKHPDTPSRVIVKNNIFPTIFQIYRDARPDAEIGVLYEWETIKYLVDTLSLNHHAESVDYLKHPTVLGDMSCEYIKAKKPNLVAICYGNPDEVGHELGWESPEYMATLTELDGYIAQIVQATRDAGIYDDTVFIITSDHGGVDKGHGKISMLEMETPFIIVGKGIKHGEITDSMMQYDVGATIAAVLGITDYIPQVWIGRPMTQAFK